MTERDYKLVCLLIDKNTEICQPIHCDSSYNQMSEKNILTLKEDLKLLIDDKDGLYEK